MTDRLPKFLKKNLYRLDPDFQVLKVVKNRYPRIAFQVRIKDGIFLIKALQSRFPWIRASRHFRFHKERFIYKHLGDVEFHFFRHPKVYHVGNSFFITEFIPNDTSLKKDSAYYESAINGIAEFNTSDFPCERHGCIGWVWEKLNRLKFAKSAKILRTLCVGFFVKRKLPLRVFLKSLAFWKQSMAKTQRLTPPIIVHRDIFHGNILRPSSNQVVFVDFEKMGLEKRWFFIDALRLIQADPLFIKDASGSDENNVKYGFPRFYAPVLVKYWNFLLERRPDIDGGDDHFRRQLRFSLLDWTLHKLVKEKHGKEVNAMLVTFIESVIMGRHEQFEQWFRRLPHPDAENRL